MQAQGVEMTAETLILEAAVHVLDTAAERTNETSPRQLYDITDAVEFVLIVVARPRYDLGYARGLKLAHGALVNVADVVDGSYRLPGALVVDTDAAIADPSRRSHFSQLMRDVLKAVHHAVVLLRFRSGEVSADESRRISSAASSVLKAVILSQDSVERLQLVEELATIDGYRGLADVRARVLAGDPPPYER